MAAFGSLRAEDEPWLEKCFVPPRDFELMGRESSVIVFGAPGTGKTAVQEMLLNGCRDPAGKPKYVVARWRPNLLRMGSTVGFQSVPNQVSSVFSACGMAVLEYLAAYPYVWDEAPVWARQQLIWFAHRFVKGDLAARAAYLLEQSEGTGSEIVASIVHSEIERDLIPPNDWSQVAAELSKALIRSGLKGVWVVVDGAEPWVDRRFDDLVSSFSAFFSTLPLFEQSDFAYKVFLPALMQPHLAAAAGSERHRVRSYLLDWSEDKLIDMVERRLALAFGRRSFTLGELCSAKGLLEWLRRGGGNRPRSWFELVRPLVACYISEDREEPIEESEWRELRRQAPPRLVLDEANRRAIVGGREVRAKEMTSGGYRLLCYLYENAGRVVPWNELYYRGYRGLDHMPRSAADENYEPPSSYESILYSRVSDLRKAIEPDPQSPLYLDTIRGKGISLRLRW